MSEQLPDSITNNYAIQPQPGGLLLAESRANHSYGKDQHPHPMDTIYDPEPWDPRPVEHDKQRGIAYEETEHEGKAYTIAERPDPKKRPRTGTSAPEPVEPALPEPLFPELSLPEPASSEQGETVEVGTKVQYEPDKEGNVRLGTELTRPGEVLDWDKTPWAKGEHRNVVFETEDGDQFYVKGNTLYDLVASRISGQAVSLERDPAFEFPNITVGERYLLGPGHITKIAVGEGIAAPGLLGEHGPIDAEYEKRGRNPFEEAEELLDSLKDNGSEDETRKMPEADANHDHGDDPMLTPTPAPTPTREPQVPSPDQAPKSDRFRPDQSGIAWFRENRAPRLKKLLRNRKFGKFVAASAAVAVDYGASTYNHGPNISGRMMPEIDAMPERDPDEPTIAEKLAVAIANAKTQMAEKTLQMAEKLGNFSDAVDYLGNVALIETAYRAGNLRDGAAYHAGNVAAFVHERLRRSGKETDEISTEERAILLTPMEEELARQQQADEKDMHTESRKRRWEWDDDFDWLDD